MTGCSDSNRQHRKRGRGEEMGGRGVTGSSGWSPAGSNGRGKMRNGGGCCRVGVKEGRGGGGGGGGGGGVQLWVRGS